MLFNVKTINTEIPRLLGIILFAVLQTAPTTLFNKNRYSLKCFLRFVQIISEKQLVGRDSKLDIVYCNSSKLHFVELGF